MGKEEKTHDRSIDDCADCSTVGSFASSLGCIMCQKETIAPILGKEASIAKHRGTISKRSNSTQPKAGRPAESLTAPTKIMLKRHGLIDFEKTTLEEVPKSAHKEAKSKIEIYQNLLNCINISGSGPIFRALDLNVFYQAFSCNFKDHVFMRFMEKLQDDPLIYSKDDKSQILYILIFAAAYCTTHGVDSRRLSKKIGECSFLFKPSSCFDLPFIGDCLVDRFIAQMRGVSADLDGAIFLNGIYLRASKDKEMFNIFHRRLLESLAIVADKHIFSFLKHVFTHSTVLFSCISHDQVIKLIVSFYRSASKAEHVLGILTVLLDKIDDETVHEFLESEAMKLDLKKPKHLKVVLAIQARSLGSLGEFKDFFVQNRDSCSALDAGMNELKRIKGFVSGDKQVLGLLDVVVSLFSTLKPEFLEGFLTRIMSFAIELVPKIKSFDEDFVDFNQKSWDFLSDLILVAQRVGLENHETKKKAGITLMSEVGRMGTRLAEVLYQAEDRAEKSGVVSIVRVKKRGFRFQ